MPSQQSWTLTLPTLVVCLALGACRAEREDETAAARGGDTADTAAAPLSGIFYGITADAVGQRAWIVSLEEPPTRARTYSARGAAELCDINVDTTGRVTWNTGGVFGRSSYTFAGRRSADGMRGTLRRATARGDTASADLALRRLQPSAQGAEAGRLAGFFSSMRYIEESGDLVGTNLLLLRDADSLVGALTISEGAPSPPYPLLHPRRDGDTLRFGIKTASVDRYGAPSGDPELMFAAVFAGDSVHLQQTDAIEGEVLRRRGSVAEHLARNPVRGCP